jgi:hypothetical protein
MKNTPKFFYVYRKPFANSILKLTVEQLGLLHVNANLTFKGGTL